MTRYIERKIDPAEIPAVQQQLRKGAKRKLEILQILTEEARLPVSFYRTRDFHRGFEPSARSWLADLYGS